MSELKAVHAFDVYEAYTKTGDDEAAQVYLKSEADKVIADLEESHKKEVGQLLIEIAELKKAQRWIKVCEEKPRNGDLILVLFSERTNGHYFPMDVVRWDSSYELGEIEVSHWMPLPSAPKEIDK